MAVRTEEGADPNGFWTAVVGGIGVVVTMAIIVALQALFNRVDADERQRKIYDAVSNELTRARAEQLEGMNTYGWVDKDAGVVAIPIDKAMELTVRDLQISHRNTMHGGTSHGSGQDAVHSAGGAGH